MRTPRLILVTDRRRVADGGLVRAVEQAVAGGVGMVILRERDLPAGELLALARRLREVTLGRAFFLVEDRADVAAACGADGVHLDEEGLPVDAAQMLAPNPEAFLVGRSAHSVADAERALAEGADYVLAGPVYPDAAHSGVPAVGTALLQAIASLGIAPLYAAGGITAENAAECLRAGAHGVAVSTPVLAHPDPEAAARRLVNAIMRRN